MLIRMTVPGMQLIALLTAGAAAAGGVLGADAGGRAGRPAPTALVIDAAAARDGRDLVDSRLRAVNAAVRLPRSSAEARTNVRYFTSRGYRVVVVGPRAGAAARAAGVVAVRKPELTSALAAVGHGPR